MSILGTGLIGGSIGLACRSSLSHIQIAGYSNQFAGWKQAVSRGAIQEGFDDPAAAVTGADLVILCTPVGAFREILTKISGSLKPGSIVTDVGSTKRSVVALAGQLLPAHVQFVGSHPMAGGEKHGIEHARANLLQHSTCILTPTGKTDPQALETIEKFWQSLDMRTIHMTPDLHDQLVADVSHLPHAVAAAMVRIQTEAGLKLAARGFADTTRIAGGDSGLWRDILLDNRDNLKAGILRLQEELTTLLDRLQSKDDAAVREWLTTAAEARKKLPPLKTDPHGK